MGARFFLKFTLKNIWNKKSLSGKILLGFIITITIITSLNLWVTEMDEQLIEDIIDSVDYEMLVLPVLPHQTANLFSWLDGLNITSEVDKAYNHLAFFNAEDKNLFYDFLTDFDGFDAVTQPHLLLLSEESIPIIANQFEVNGTFALKQNEVLISEYQATKLKTVYNQTIVPGMKLNLSVCMNNPEYGRYLYQLNPTHYYNITVRGIYNLQVKESTLQRTFPNYMWEDSIIFLQESLYEGEIEDLEEKGIYPKIWAKIDSEVLASDGFEGIIPKIELLAEKLILEYPLIAIIELTSPYLDLELAYSRAERIFVLVIPSIIVACIQSLLIIHTAVNQREEYINTVIDRGGLEKQIVAMTIFEYSIIAVFAVPLAILPSYCCTALIPMFVHRDFSWNTFLMNFSNLSFPTRPLLFSSIPIILLTIIICWITTKIQLNRSFTQRDAKFGQKLRKAIAIIFLIVSAIALLTFILIRTIPEAAEYKYQWFFNAEESNRASTYLLLIITMLIVTGLLSVIGVYEILGGLKKIYAFFSQKIAFFTIHHHKKSRHKLFTVYLLLIVLNSLVFYSIFVKDSLETNESITTVLRNGADLRIETSSVGYQYTDNLSQIEGIDEIMPVLQLDAEFNQHGLTINCIDPVKYSSIGKWDASCFRNDLAPANHKDNTYEDWLDLLNDSSDGIIVSDEFVLTRGLEIGDAIQFENFFLGGFPETIRLTIIGIMHSIPGFGLAANTAYGSVGTKSYALVNEYLAFNHMYGRDLSLFLATAQQNKPLAQIEEEIKLIEGVQSVNRINYEAEEEDFVTEHIPKATTFFTIQIIILISILGIIIPTQIGNCLTGRKPANTLFMALGMLLKDFFTMSHFELTLMILTTLIGGFILGSVFSLLTIKTAVPFLSNYLVIPLRLTFDSVWLISYSLVMICIVYFTSIPSIVQVNKERSLVSIT